MKVEIREIGPIKKIEFDLSKDLHLIYGKNNVGKSYAVNILYCVVKNLQKSEDDFGWIQNEHLGSNMIEEKIKKGNGRLVNIQDDLGKAMKNGLEINFLENLKRSLNNTYHESNNENKLNFNIRISTNDYSLFLLYKNNKLTIVKFKLEYQVQSKYSKTRKVFSTKRPDQLFNSLSQERIENEIWFNERTVDDFTFQLTVEIWRNFYEQLFLSIGGMVAMLPAHRSGLYTAMSGMGELIALLATQTGKGSSRSGVGKIGLPSMNEPASDYYLRLMNTKNKNKSISFKIAEKIEKEILKGKIAIDDKTKKIYYYPKDLEKKIPITESASMVSELSTIVLFLKHGLVETRSRGSFLLIIEEPEAHLHPEAQTLLMEIFVELTKLNIKVILTSHSNYMFNKLSNLILSKKIQPEKVEVYHIVKGKSGSIVRKDMKATEEGMEDHNFVGTAEKLYKERMSIYQKINERIDANK